jgi:hypothetical protein
MPDGGLWKKRSKKPGLYKPYVKKTATQRKKDKGK